MRRHACLPIASDTSLPSLPYKIPQWSTVVSKTSPDASSTGSEQQHKVHPVHYPETTTWTTTHPIHDEQPTNNPMTVSFRDANGAAVDFKMKPSTKLGKAMAAFSNKIGHDPMQLRFLFDGERVAEEDTPTTVSLVSDW